MQCRCADFYQVVDGCKAQRVETLPHMFLFIVAVGFPRYPMGVPVNFYPDARIHVRIR